MNATFRLKAGIAAAVTAVALSACGGGSTSPVTPIVAPSATPSSSAALGATAAVAYGAPALSGATFVKRALLGSVGADVVMTMRDSAGLLAYAKNANDPKSAVFRHWLTPQQLGDRFGASTTDYNAAAKYFVSNGMAVVGYPQRQILRIGGSQANVERALGIEFGQYRKNGQTFVAPMTAPHPPAALHIAAVGNVVRYNARSRRFRRLSASSSFVDGYAPQQIANGFDYAGAYAAGYKGDGMTIGIIGTGAITDGDPRIKLGDVADFRSLYGITGTGKVVQDVDLTHYSGGDGASGPTQYSQTGLATPPPVTSPSSAGCVAQGFSLNDENYNVITDFTTCNPEDLESQLDTEQASALAPDATVNFYIAYNPSECFGTCSSTNTPSQQLGLNESDDEIQQAIADAKSDVISMSFGEDELSSTQAGYFGSGTNNFEPVEFASLVSEGTAVFASSGDNGAEECMDNPGSADLNQPCVSYPATDTSVISVGGVNAPLSESGRLVGPITGWGEATQAVSGAPGGSGGGCSAYFDAPTYETTVSPTLPCAGKRPQPDVSLDADTNTGVAVDFDADSTLGGRIILAVGGTSVASPEMAAMWSLVVQACKASATCAAHGSGTYPYRLGNPGTYLYKIYVSPTEYPASFYDVLFGNNSLPNGTVQDPGFTAGKGYDLVTGIGVPYGKNLISSVLANVP